MLKIRLMRIGGKKKPFYRVVVLDERSKRTGAYIELLGTYNPLTEPKDIKLKQDRIDYWTGQGAQPSTGYLRIIGKAPQRPPRKPKREKKTEEPAKLVPENSEKPVDQNASESETPASSDTSGAPSLSESSEKESKVNEKEEVADERPA